MNSVSTMTTPKVTGLTEDEQRELDQLFKVWAAKTQRNALRVDYYNGHNAIKDLGISVPPSLKNIVDSVVMWPAKAVDSLAARSMFDGFVTSGNTEDPLGLRPMLDANQFDLLYAQAVVSELTHSVSFITTTLGGVGDPDVLISLRSAEYASAIWDFRRRRIRSGMAVVDLSTETPSEPTLITMYLSEWVITCQKSQNAWKVVERRINPLGRPLMEPMPFAPSERRPFGRSRISREVMSLTDMAQRGALRADILMEFNTAPARYLMGADEEAFRDSKWSAYMNTFLSISKDEDGETPTLGQLSQLSPQGAISYMQHLASRFSGATGVPLSSLGIVQDNPASAQAMEASKDEIVTTTHAMNRVNRIALTNVARMGLALRDRVTLDQLPEEAASLQGRFRNPALPSVVSQSDAMVKQIAAIPWLADTEVALEELGYDESQIQRLLSDKRRQQAPGILDKMITARDGGGTGDSESADLKGRADALGILVRAGVDPDDAAVRVGLPGVKFTGAVPVSLRQPETDARGLEEK